MTLNEIGERWQRFSQTGFPSLRGQFEVDGVCLVLADTLAAGCISAFCRRTGGGRLDAESGAVLLRTLSNLDRVIARMPNPEVEAYFRELMAIARAVLEHDEAV
jgi:hypothetical protein